MMYLMIDFMKKIKNIELTRNSKKQLNFYKNFYEYIDNIHLNKQWKLILVKLR